MTSSAVNNNLLKYIESSLFLHRVKRESNVFSLTEGDSKEKFFTELDPFSCYGKFLKAATVCFPTVKRVSILTSFCMRAVEHGIDRSGIGRAIHTMCSKWAFSECAKVLETILAANGGRLLNIFEEIEKNAPGSLPDLEIEHLRHVINSGYSAFINAGAEDLSILFESHAAVRPLLLLMSESLW
ncbi:hypothetical protein OESDEN_06267 [Oesophagostomum dentatum]|uniref:Uncharacterized protein n=1 Tax=Oesophagostomum dentatum TaxID=61180 RepID=A0A0B1TEK0_OESDE|nr:hypothetical protein OESDEN_06267 [Oesophagostomum dentatum]